jgi:hypothetical protein
LAQNAHFAPPLNLVCSRLVCAIPGLASQVTLAGRPLLTATPAAVHSYALILPACLTHALARNLPIHTYQQQFPAFKGRSQRVGMARCANMWATLGKVGSASGVARSRRGRGDGVRARVEVKAHPVVFKNTACVRFLHLDPDKSPSDFLRPTTSHRAPGCCLHRRLHRRLHRPAKHVGHSWEGREAPPGWHGPGEGVATGCAHA